MTVEVIDVVIRESGGERAAKQIRKVGSQAKQTSSSLDLMKRSLGALTGALAIDTLIRYADAFTTIQNRLRLVTDSGTQLVRVQNELFAIAGRSQSQISTTAELYNRLANASDDFFISEKRLLGITELVNKSLLISGTGLQTSQAAITQFSQALSSGQLRGEEFNSVVEQAPRLARALADGLGLTIGKLRELAFTGGLTTEKVLKAIESQSSKINKEAESIVPTIGRSFAQVQNEFTKFVAIFDKAFDVSEKTSTTLQKLAEILPDIALKGVESINAIRAAFKTWADAIPDAGTAITGLGGNMDAVKAAAEETITFLRDAVVAFPQNIKTVIDIAVIEITDTIEKVKSKFQDVIDFAKKAINTFKGVVAQIRDNALPSAEAAAAVDAAIAANAQIDADQQERYKQENKSSSARQQTATEIMNENEAARSGAVSSYQKNFKTFEAGTNNKLAKSGLLPNGNAGQENTVTLQDVFNRQNTGNSFSDADFKTKGRTVKPQIIDPKLKAEAAVSYDDVYRASLKSKNTGNSFSDSDFRTVQFVLPNGDKVKMNGSAGSVDRLTSNISNQSLKAGRR